ncbi:hypothetical protein CKO44_16395 [Rubrivivax gelatinosus]|uniref:HAD family hydrolase n=1 Tax=Rubrivivax gelatinosus TaxID=28068 RepID=UPI0019088B5E|nr:HAD family phosphatase [Rubrivivax gelatinosus]MBK1615050.1 hypothetical protein [Rubrivivax gelatinosus]
MSATYAAALFDMDGLLLDTERTIMASWLRCARERGVTLAESHYLQIVGLSTAESDALLIGCFSDERCFAEVRERVAQELEQRHAQPGSGCKPGAAALLEALARHGVPCAVASSSAQAEIDARLRAAGLRQHFSAIAGGDEVARGKPDPAVYTLAAQRLGVPAARCIAFEDSRNGAHAALAAGADVVVVPDLVPPGAELAARCVVVLDSLEQALDHLPRWFATAPAAIRATCP